MSSFTACYKALNYNQNSKDFDKFQFNLIDSNIKKNQSKKTTKLGYEFSPLKIIRATKYLKPNEGDISIELKKLKNYFDGSEIQNHNIESTSNLNLLMNNEKVEKSCLAKLDKSENQLLNLNNNNIQINQIKEESLNSKKYSNNRIDNESKVLNGYFHYLSENKKDEFLKKLESNINKANLMIKCYKKWKNKNESLNTLHQSYRNSMINQNVNKNTNFSSKRFNLINSFCNTTSTDTGRKFEHRNIIDFSLWKYKSMNKCPSLRSLHFTLQNKLSKNKII